MIEVVTKIHKQVFLFVTRMQFDWIHLSYRRKMLLRSSFACRSSSVTSSLETREISSTTLCCIARHVLFSSLTECHMNRLINTLSYKSIWENVSCKETDNLTHTQTVKRVSVYWWLKKPSINHSICQYINCYAAYLWLTNGWRAFYKYNTKGF